MPQWKEKSDKLGHYSQEEFFDLLNILESSNPENVESVKNMIHEIFSSNKDSKLHLYYLVDFWMVTHSKSALEILLHVKDPHEKHIFEKINEMMKSESTRYNALQLLGNIVYGQPSWLYKITNHRVIFNLFHMLKTDVNAPNLLNGLFIVICLLPMIPHLFGTFLTDAFDIFSRLAAWNLKKPSTLPDILNLHLQTGIYSLFHRLYGMFPCNFLAYLRSFYGGRDCTEENIQVFSLVIKPMLERVRLHPLLVTASKEAELNVNRWKKMDYHDIIVDCSSVSLDTVEGTCEGFKTMHIAVSPHIEKNFTYESTYSLTSNCQKETSITTEFGPSANDTMSVSQNIIWSPIQACTTVAPTSYSDSMISPTIKKGEWEFKNIMQLSTEENIPLDFAVEAKPENMKSDLEIPEKLSSKGADKDVSDLISSQMLEHSLSDVDNEVCNLTSSHTLDHNTTAEEARLDTPFCSTTQNLTDEPTKFPQTVLPSFERSDSLTKSIEEDVDEMYSSMQDSDMQSFIPTYNRYRYFSHCGPPPDLVQVPQKPKALRSTSCPAKIYPLIENTDVKNCDSTNLNKTETVTNSDNVIKTAESAFVSLTDENSVRGKENIPAYEQLLTAVVNPLQDFEHHIDIGLPGDPSQSQNSKSLSPPELLDIYIQHGSTAHLNHLPLTSTKDTDWTHFGGNPPPDEIEILRNQVLLLHNLVLFERHRKDIHSERNRRIFGRVKRMRMQEECVEALKKEIVILREKIANLKNELCKQYKLYQQLLDLKNKSESELDSKIIKRDQENTQLVFSNKQLQLLLVSQKEENDAIIKLYEKAQSVIIDIKCQLKCADKEMQDCQKVRKEAIFLTKQLLLLQELNTQYKNKIEQMKEPLQPDTETKLLNESLFLEIEDLKQKIEAQMILLDSSKGKLTEFENLLSNTKLSQTEKINSLETIENYHQAEILACEERIGELRKVSLEKDAHILKLYADLDVLQQKLDSVERRLSSSANINNDCSSSNGQNQTSSSIQIASEVMP